MTKNVLINVAEEIKSPSALTQEQGNIIFSKIIDAIDNESVVSLDFSQVESIISPFLNNAIGQLYGLYTSEQLRSHLNIQNFPDEKKATLNIVIANAKRYYINKTKFDSTVKEVFNS